MQFEQILKTELNQLKTELIEAYDDKGMRASGRWADELEVKVSKNKEQILGLEYTRQLEEGRSPGGFPPVDIIEQWVVDKNIQAIDDAITTRTLAFLIARKIAREGWQRQEQGGVDLISDVITPKRLESILGKLTDANLVEFSSEITSIFVDAFK